MTSLLNRAVRREPLSAGDGKSGSSLERVTLDDGTFLVVKRVSHASDWEVRVTGDDGRAVRLWREGILDRVPPVIDHTTVGAEQDGEDWLIVMRDVTDALIPDDMVIDRAAGRRILEAQAAMHRTFRGERLDGLLPLDVRLALLSPATAEKEAGTHLVPTLVGRGWELFGEVVPGDVAGEVMAILRDTGPLAQELERQEQTLIHGDPKLSNVGFSPGRVVLVDWGTLTGMAPPAMELAEHLALNASRIGATREEVIEDFRAAEADLHDDRALRLCLLAGLVMLGWNKALDAADHPEPQVRDRERADLDWWVARAREALDEWSPTA